MTYVNERAGTLVAINLLLVGCVCASPVPVNDTFRIIFRKSLAEIVEDCKFLFAVRVVISAAALCR
jgi:uncharacterized protein YcfL